MEEQITSWPPEAQTVVRLLMADIRALRLEVAETRVVAPEVRLEAADLLAEAADIRAENVDLKKRLGRHERTNKAPRQNKVLI